MDKYELRQHIHTISSEIRAAGIDTDGSGITNKDLINWAMQSILMDKLNKVSDGLNDVRQALYRGV